MKLKYIGDHGAMGLSYGQVYEVALYADDAIIVSVFHDHKLIATPVLWPADAGGGLGKDQH